MIFTNINSFQTPLKIVLPEIKKTATNNKSLTELWRNARELVGETVVAATFVPSQHQEVGLVQGLSPPNQHQDFRFNDGEIGLHFSYLGSFVASSILLLFFLKKITPTIFFSNIFM